MHEISAVGIVGLGAFGLIGLVVQIFYLWSLYSAMKAVPEKHHMFPAWFIWMMIIPFVNIIFAWIMIPFGLPKTMEEASGSNQAMKEASKTLFGIGLAQMILFTLFFIPIVNIITLIGGFVLWIIYWVKVASFKKTYLTGTAVIEHE